MKFLEIGLVFKGWIFAPFTTVPAFLPLGGALHDLESESRAKVPPLSSTPGTNAYPVCFEPR